MGEYFDSFSIKKNASMIIRQLVHVDFDRRVMRHVSLALVLFLLSTVDAKLSFNEYFRFTFISIQF